MPGSQNGITETRHGIMGPGGETRFAYLSLSERVTKRNIKNTARQK
jgi:hypothetical protein